MMVNLNWQDYLVLAAIVLAVAYLWRTRIAPRLRREPTGCENCAAHQAITSRRNVKVVKLNPEQAEEVRAKLHNERRR